MGYIVGLSCVKITDHETVFTTRALSLRCLKYQDFNLLVRYVNPQFREQVHKIIFGSRHMYVTHQLYIPRQILAKLKL